MAKGFSTKRIAIDKAQATIVVAVGISAFLVVFSMVASRALFSQMRYQSKVSSQKEQALEALESNLVTSDQLITAYQAFSGETVNILGGNPQGDADQDGDNPRIILDALPSKYDFPALTTSLEKLLEGNGFSITSITGNDDEVAQSALDSSSTPLAIEIPFTVEVGTTDRRGKDLMQLFERSIRPMQIDKLILGSQGDQLKATITAKTYFQPEKSLNVKKEIVR